TWLMSTRRAPRSLSCTLSPTSRPCNSIGKERTSGPSRRTNTSNRSGSRSTGRPASRSWGGCAPKRPVAVQRSPSGPSSWGGSFGWRLADLRRALLQHPLQVRQGSLVLLREHHPHHRRDIPRGRGTVDRPTSFCVDLSIRASPVRGRVRGGKRPLITRRSTMAQYLLSVHSVEGQIDTPMTDEEMQESWKQIQALNEELKSAGAWVFGGALHEPDTATVVRMSNGEVMTTDGPFAESKEHLGGFYIIEADDLDAAIGWASKTTACVMKPIEVRPFRQSEA